tara:strand:- start:711 stop:1259 length:549 start_codon:yes stop_codon:yes gene_type:complete
MENKPKLILPESVKKLVIDKKKDKVNKNAWYFQNGNVNEELEITKIDQLFNSIDGDKCFGFVYLIENLDNGRKYIGKKQLEFNRRTKLGKKALSARVDKRTSKHKTTTKESDWVIYTGSNLELNKDIEDGNRIKKHILALSYNKSELSYHETKYQFVFNVLETPEYYNGNILGKFFNRYKSQ